MMKELILLGAIFAGDQKLKSNSERHRLPAQDDEGKGSLFFSNYHNAGAALNAGEKHPVLVTTLALSLTVFCTILFLFTLTKKGVKGLRIGLALLLGGAYSNLYDRLKRKYVVDYIALRLPARLQNGRIEELVFNVADLLIAVGAMVLSIRGVT